MAEEKKKKVVKARVTLHDPIIGKDKKVGANLAFVYALYKEEIDSEFEKQVLETYGNVGGDENGDFVGTDCPTWARNRETRAKVLDVLKTSLIKNKAEGFSRPEFLMTTLKEVSAAVGTGVAPSYSAACDKLNAVAAILKVFRSFDSVG